MPGSRTSWIAIAAALAAPAPGGDQAQIIDDLADRGLDAVAPAEMEIARDLLASGDAHLVDLQVGLLDEIAEAHDLEDRALEAERMALQAENEADAEQAAYEFLVEQILASGVASFWGTP